MAGETELTIFENPEELEVGIDGPDQANRLLIYTGIAKLGTTGSGQVAPTNDIALSFPIFINLSKLHNNRKFNPTNTHAAPVAFLANVHGNDAATDITWAVSNVRVLVDNEELKLFANLFVQGEKSSFGAIAYQVNVTTQTIRLAKFDVSPAQVVRGNTATATVELSAAAPSGPGQTGLSVNLGTDLANEFVSFPANVIVPPGHITGSVPLHTKTLTGPRPPLTSTTITAEFRGDTKHAPLDILK